MVSRCVVSLLGVLQEKWVKMGGRLFRACTLNTRHEMSRPPLLPITWPCRYIDESRVVVLVVCSALASGRVWSPGYSLWQ